MSANIERHRTTVPVLQGNSNDNIQKPQTLILEIIGGQSISNVETFLRTRIGNAIDFRIDNKVVKAEDVHVKVVFPSKTASRKAEASLHAGNKKHIPKVWCYFYKEKKKSNATSEKVKLNIQYKDELKGSTTGCSAKTGEINKKTKYNHNVTRTKTDDNSKPQGERSDIKNSEDAVNCDKQETKTGIVCQTQNEFKFEVKSTSLDKKKKTMSNQNDIKDVKRKTQQESDQVKNRQSNMRGKSKQDSTISANGKSYKSNFESKTNTNKSTPEASTFIVDVKEAEATNSHDNTQEKTINMTCQIVPVIGLSMPTNIGPDLNAHVEEHKSYGQLDQPPEANVNIKEKLAVTKEFSNNPLEDMAYDRVCKLLKSQNDTQIMKHICKDSRVKEGFAQIEKINKNYLTDHECTTDIKTIQEMHGTLDTNEKQNQKTKSLTTLEANVDHLEKGEQSESLKQHQLSRSNSQEQEQTINGMNKELICDVNFSESERNTQQGMQRNEFNLVKKPEISPSLKTEQQCSSADSLVCNIQSTSGDEALKGTAVLRDCGVKTNSKCKPQVLEVEIRNYDAKDLSFESFLLQRFQRSFTFTIIEKEIIQNVIILSVEFPSTKSSKEARLLLHKSNSSSKIKVWCSLDKRRKQQLKIQRLSTFVDGLANIAQDLITKHNHQIQKLSLDVDRVTDKKPKFQTIETYERRKKEKEALESKVTEMKNQKSEFRSFLASVYEKLENLKNAAFEEKDLLELEIAFQIECERFCTKLPVYARRTDIVKGIHMNQTSVILGETGSGKSTQVVQYLYQTGRFAQGTIVCTQPRKVAAISLATHVAKEMKGNVGHVVGYQVGLHTKKSHETKILYMTDHVLLNECLKDPLLSSFSCIIIDEAHERSIFTDLLLGMIKSCLPSRPDLRVVITSATIDPDVFVRFFGDCIVLSVSGRTFPVEINWLDEECDDNYEQRTLQKAIEVHRTEGKGDMLVFLTSPLEVEKCCEKFQDQLQGQNDFICVPLHGKLQANEQQRVFDSSPRGKRKIVFATNSAETSITIPGIKYVVDSGRIKEMQFDTKKNISSLVVTLVTKSSANQRSGRAGRTAPGKCFRLYSQKGYNEMTACSTPEILRVNLGQALLKLIELGVEPLSFDFVESPPRNQLTNAMETLESIGAVKDGVITDLGRWVAKLPFHPIYGVFVHDALKCKVGIEALVLTACCGSGGSFFYRSGSVTDKANADKIKIRFSHKGGDLMTMLNAYREWHEGPEKGKGKWCKQNYVNGKTIKAVRETVTEVLSILRKELQIKLEFKFNKLEKVDLLLQKMLFKTFKHNLCHFLGHDKAGYHVIHKKHNVCLFPSSALPSLGLQPEWIVIEQVLKINREYGVNATPVPVEWIEEGLEEGWLKSFDISEAEQQQVKLICMYGVGDQSFRDFVGPRYSKLKDLEDNLQIAVGKRLVIVDADSKTGEITIFASLNMSPIIKPQMYATLNSIYSKYKDETSEQYLSSLNQGTRVVMSAGCNIADILMPDEYKSVIVVSDPQHTSSLSAEEVRTEFEKYGEIERIEQFRYTKNKQRNWGKLTFKTTQEAENAVDNSKEEEISARPTGNTRLQSERRYRAKIEWCRRPSKQFGFVEFIHENFVNNILMSHNRLVIGGDEAKLLRSRHMDSDNQIFVTNLNRFVNDEVLRHSFVTTFCLRDDHIVRASVVREKVHTSKREVQTIYQRICAHLEPFVKQGRYELYLKPPKDTDFKFLAYASFSKIEEGDLASANLVENFRPNGEIVHASITLQSSLLVIKPVFEKCNAKLLTTVTDLSSQDGIEIRHRVLNNGNCVVDLNCDHIDTLHRVRRKLEKIIQGKKMTKHDFPNIYELFTRAGKYEIRKVMTQTDTLIIDDYRILEISIFGKREQMNEAFLSLEEYLLVLAEGVTKTLTLKGPDKPYGVIKELFLRFGIDLGKLKQGIEGLHCLQIDLRDHTIHINGTSQAVEKGVIEVNNVIDYLRVTQHCEHFENEERLCSICFSEIEDGEIYRLEACGHPFCKTCIIPQLESAVGNSDFPISCCKEDCSELWAWRDLTKLTLQSGMSINNLVNRATNSYIAKHEKEYRYCISPDCPTIYRVTVNSDVFCCCECEARICTACHTQYHDGFTCEMMKELKDDSSGIKIWLRKDPHNRKLCPSCGLPIEKAGGCNHMECVKCRRHICWICLEYFESSRDCYKHLGEKHGGYGGGY